MVQQETTSAPLPSLVFQYVASDLSFIKKQYPTEMFEAAKSRIIYILMFSRICDFIFGNLINVYCEEKNEERERVKSKKTIYPPEKGIKV